MHRMRNSSVRSWRRKALVTSLMWVSVSGMNAGCDVALLSDTPDRTLLPNCADTDDGAIIQALDQIENAWQQGVSRLDVLAIGLGSGCQDECFTCWQEITDLVYFSIHTTNNTP